MIREFLAAVFLTINAARDLKKREIDLHSISAFGIAGFIRLCRIVGEGQAVRALSALLPGVFLLFVGRMSGGRIGYGDGLVILVLGGLLGASAVCEISLSAFFLTACFGGIQMMRKAADGRDELPWIPFVWLAYMGRLVIDII